MVQLCNCHSHCHVTAHTHLDTRRFVNFANTYRTHRPSYAIPDQAAGTFVSASSPSDDVAARTSGMLCCCPGVVRQLCPLKSRCTLQRIYTCHHSNLTQLKCALHLHIPFRHCEMAEVCACPPVSTPFPCGLRTSSPSCPLTHLRFQHGVAMLRVWALFLILRPRSCN